MPRAFSRCPASRLATRQFYSSIDPSETRTKPAGFALLPLGAVRVGPSHNNFLLSKKYQTSSPEPGRANARFDYTTTNSTISTAGLAV
jgi:hypothetical protein